MGKTKMMLQWFRIVLSLQWFRIVWQNRVELPVVQNRETEMNVEWFRIVWRQTTTPAEEGRERNRD